MPATQLCTLLSDFVQLTAPEEFARSVDETIADFATYDRPWYWDVARNAANDAQRIAPAC